MGPLPEDLGSTEIDVDVNGRKLCLRFPVQTLLLDLLRDRLGLTAAKRACDVQVCGACTVLVDGKPVSSCCYLAADADGRSLLTCEGIADGSHLSRLQREFVSRGAFQCGYCTPGMLLAATALLETNPAPSREEVVRHMEGNLCRCTGYARIVEAILAAAPG